MTVDIKLFEDIEKNVGQQTTVHLGEITAMAIRRYAVAIGDPNPLYHDSEYARSAGYPDIVAPPNMLPSVLEWGVGSPEEELNPDGTRREHLPGVDTTGMRVMGGGEDMQFHRPVVAGCSVTQTTTLTEADTRETRTGLMIVLRYRNEYRDGTDTTMMTCDRTMLLR
jgi:acyl dehydratase